MPESSRGSGLAEPPRGPDIPAHATTSLLPGLRPSRHGARAAGGPGEREGGAEPRRAAVARWTGWSRGREPRATASRPLVWLHAPSVGEGLQAESVLMARPAPAPRLAVRVHWFSPSAESLGRRLPVDVADYLPYDLPRRGRRAPDALAPDVLAFAKLDLWPELATRAARPRTRRDHGRRDGAPGNRPAPVAGAAAPPSPATRRPAAAAPSPRTTPHASNSSAYARADPRHRRPPLRQRRRQGGRGPPRRPAPPLRQGRSDDGGRVHLAGRRAGDPRRLRAAARAPPRRSTHPRPARTDGGAPGPHRARPPGSASQRRCA